MEKDKSKWAKNIKTAGNLALYLGTASMVKPFVKEHSEERSGLAKVCTVFTGTVISCGVSALASKWWNKLVDNVTDFIDDVRNPKGKDEGVNGGTSNSK